MDRTAPRRSAKAFRIAVAVLGGLIVLFIVPYTAFVLLSSDPDETPHRFHMAAGSLASVVFAAGLLLLARRPERTAAMHLVVIGAVVSAVAGLWGSDLITGFNFVPAVAAIVALALHPDRRSALRVGRLHIPLVAVAAAVLVPALGYASGQSALQRNASSLDPHAEMHHYSGVAITALALSGTVLAAALRGVGWRIVAWIGVTLLLLFGVSVLVFGDYVGAPGAVWGWASLAAAAAVAVATTLTADRPEAATP